MSCASTPISNSVRIAAVSISFGLLLLAGTSTSQSAELVIELYADQGVTLDDSIKPIVRRPGAGISFEVVRNPEGYWSARIPPSRGLSNILRIAVPANERYAFRELEVDIPISSSSSARWVVPVGVAKVRGGLPWIHNSFETFRNVAAMRARPVRHLAVLYQQFSNVSVLRWNQIEAGRNLIDADLKIAYLHIGSLAALMQSNVSVIRSDVILRNFAFFPQLADRKIVDRFKRALETHPQLAKRVFGDPALARTAVDAYDAASVAIYRGKYTSVWRFIVALVRARKCVRALPLIADYIQEIGALSDQEVPIRREAVVASYYQCVAIAGEGALPGRNASPAEVKKVKLHLDAALKLAKRMTATTIDPRFKRRIKLEANFLAEIQKRL